MTEREKLIEKLSREWPDTTEDRPYLMEQIADFIIADRKRIVQPLVNYNEMMKNKLGGTKRPESYDLIVERNGFIAMRSIEETLKLSGVL